MDGYTFCILAIGATYPSWATSNTVFTTMFFFLFPNSDPDGAIASCFRSVLLMTSRNQRSGGKNLAKTSRILAILADFDKNIVPSHTLTRIVANDS